MSTLDYSDIDPNEWRNHSDVRTDSLWYFDKRDNSGLHGKMPNYSGNFVPQIPEQLILRYSKKGEIVLDPFAGGGTTLFEARRLGRIGMGIDLNQDMVDKVNSVLESEPLKEGEYCSFLVQGDSTEFNVNRFLNYRTSHADMSRPGVGLVILHPPYHNIVNFSDKTEDLSNCKDVDAFLYKFDEVVRNIMHCLKVGRHMALVIGDIYAKSEWIELSTMCADIIRQKNFRLKSKIVKNTKDTGAKRNNENLWIRRALTGGFSTFSYENIYVFERLQVKHND